MNGTVREWIDKAEGDFRTASREMGASDAPNYDAVCFHAQQCIEKLLKAVLIREEVLVPRIHNLGRLYELLHDKIPELSLESEKLLFLTNVGMATRYPGESADADDATETLQICQNIRKILLGMIDSD